MERGEFVKRYGGVYEHSPWVAEQSYAAAAGVTNVDELAAIFAECVDCADERTKLKLVRAHPDLAGRTAIRGELTSNSGAEQASAGLDRCSREEYQRFQELNRKYKDRFGFPFVMAVRNSSRQEILDTFSRRLGNDRQAEFETAINEIHKIARLRLRELTT